MREGRQKDVELFDTDGIERVEAQMEEIGGVLGFASARNEEKVVKGEITILEYTKAMV